MVFINVILIEIALFNQQSLVMEGEEHPILPIMGDYAMEVMMECLQPPDDVHTFEHLEFVRWLDQQALSSPGPQSGVEAVSVENMEVDLVQDQGEAENLFSLLENVTYSPEAEETEPEGQKFMELDQENSNHQGAPIPEDMPPLNANVEVEEASGGTYDTIVEQSKGQRKRKAAAMGQRQQPKRECKERQSRKAAFEQEIQNAALQQRRNKSEIVKVEHRRAGRNKSSRR